MSHDEKILWLKIITFFVGFISVLIILGIIWAREQVKKDLRHQDLAPISVRWVPFAYWAMRNEAAFRVTFVDLFGCIQNTRCAVWFQQVRWIGDDVRYLNKDLPLIGKLAYLLISMALMYFGIKHLITGRLILPPDLKNPQGIQILGWALRLLSIAAVCQAAALVTELISNWLPRASETHFTRASRAFSVTFWVLLILSMIVYAWEFFQNPNQFHLVPR